MATIEPTPQHKLIQGLAAIEAALDENRRAWKDASDVLICRPRREILIAQAEALPIMTRADAQMKLSIALKHDSNWDARDSAYQLCGQVLKWLAREPPAGDLAELWRKWQSTGAEREAKYWATDAAIRGARPMTLAGLAIQVRLLQDSIDKNWPQPDADVVFAGAIAEQLEDLSREAAVVDRGEVAPEALTLYHEWQRLVAHWRSIGPEEEADQEAAEPATAARSAALKLLAVPVSSNEHAARLIEVARAHHEVEEGGISEACLLRVQEYLSQKRWIAEQPAAAAGEAAP
jgi:hypothetical protein